MHFSALFLPFLWHFSTVSGQFTIERICLEDCSQDPDAYLNPAQIIRRYGYGSESHVVETKDGYLLTVDRISTNKNGERGNQPIFIQHGLLSSSADFVITANKSLGFILADLGYDVWLGNARGNKFSRGHKTLLPRDSAFWNFSFSEMGMFDLPAVVDYIGKTTGKKGEIIYIGHSMGTTMYFVYSSLFPEHARTNVKAMVAMAPVTELNNIVSPVKYLAPFVNDLNWIAKHVGINEFLPNLWLIKLMASQCERMGGRKDICENVIFAICGFDRSQFDETRLPAILNNAPAGASTKTLVHYGQIINEGEFKEFDYGKEENVKVYGTDTPPSYNISSISTPTYLMYGLNDWLATPDNVKELSKKLTNKHSLYQVNYEKFNHVDFLWAKDAPKLVYKALIKYIQQYT